jgi:hypothetical protein
MNHQLIAPTPKATPSCTTSNMVWARLLEKFACRKRLIGLAVVALQHNLSRAFLWMVSQSVGRVAAFLARWQQRQPLQSALDHTGKSARRPSNKVNKDRSGKRDRKSKRPAQDECTGLFIDQLVSQGNIRAGVRNVSLQCRLIVDQVDRIDLLIDTTDLAQSYMHLSYFIKDLRTGEQRRVHHSVGLATSGGRWWFVDEGRCCEALCLPPGGDRFRHPEAHGVSLSSPGRRSRCNDHRGECGSQNKVARRLRGGSRGVG